MTAEMVIAFVCGMWIGIGLLKLSELIVSIYRRRKLAKMMDSLLEDLKKLNETVEMMKKEEQKEEKVKKPRAKKTQK